MIQGISHRVLTPDSQVKFQVCQCEFCCGNNGTGTDCFLCSAFCFCPYFSNKCSILIYICILLLPGGHNKEDWTTSKNNILLEIGEHWLEKYFPLFYLEATKRSLFQVLEVFHPEVFVK